MNFEEFERELADPKPVYLLKTSQDLLRKQAFEACMGQVDEGARGFDWNVFELPQDSVAEVVAAARTLPWMAKRRWVWVRNAQEAGKAFAEYFKDPAQRTVLVLEVAKRPAGWPKTLPLAALESSSSLPSWIAARARSEGCEIDSRSIRALIDLVGEDLQRIDSELRKLCLYRLSEGRIELDDVLEMTAQAREHDIFELIGAIARRQAEPAIRILGRIFDGGAGAPMIVSMLYWNFRRLLAAREMLDKRVAFSAILRELKIWSYRGREGDVRRCSRAHLEAILMRLREADLLFKSSAIDPRTHLERVVVDMCSAGSL